MYDKELFKKICNLTCEYEDIKIDQTTIEYDYINPFEKYYSLDTIIKAIYMYKNNEISAQFIANWACVYMWIINGGYDEKLREDLFIKNPLIFYVTDLISYSLDSLSFYQEDMNDDIDEYIDIFMKYDCLLKNINEWDFYYYNYEKDEEEIDYVDLIIINEDKKLYLAVNAPYDTDLSSATELEEEECFNKLKELDDNGYIEYYNL